MKKIFILITMLLSISVVYSQDRPTGFGLGINNYGPNVEFLVGGVSFTTGGSIMSRNHQIESPVTRFGHIGYLQVFRSNRKFTFGLKPMIGLVTHDYRMEGNILYEKQTKFDAGMGLSLVHEKFITSLSFTNQVNSLTILYRIF